VGVGDETSSKLPQAEAAANLKGFYGYPRIQQHRGLPISDNVSVTSAAGCEGLDLH